MNIRYIANPYLINGHKFDLRLYVYVTSHDPLRIYLFDDGEKSSPSSLSPIDVHFRLDSIRFAKVCLLTLLLLLFKGKLRSPLIRYSSSVKSLSDRFMHLTNYSINRYNSEYRTNNDSGACTGHKWCVRSGYGRRKILPFIVAGV